MRYFIVTGALILMICCPQYTLSGQARCQETPLLHSAYQLIFRLQLDSARGLLDISRAQDPDNLLVELVDSYIDFLKAFINEDKASFEAFAKAKEARLERLKDRNINSPYQDFMVAEIYLQYALVRSKHKEYIRAGWDINRAYKLLSKCRKEYPDFILANKSMSVIHALIGSIKGFRRGLIELFTALEGSLPAGIQESQSVYYWSSEDHHSLWHPEIAIIRSLIMRHVEQRPIEALQVLQTLEGEYSESPLIHYFMGAIYDDLGRSEEAIAQWSWVWHQDQLPMYYLDFLKGTALLNRMDPSADQYLKRYITYHKGLHYQKEARQKLAWYELLINQDVTQYARWMRDCLHVGNTDFDEDQQAEEEARSGVIPHRDLLRCRLLYDGGRLTDALATLEELDKGLLPHEWIEYHYRKGRILQGLQDTSRAMQAYLKVIQQGGTDDRYYACSAALQMGLILEHKSEYRHASHYFQKALKMKPKEYKASLHQKARMALERISIDLDQMENK